MLVLSSPTLMMHDHTNLKFARVISLQSLISKIIHQLSKTCRTGALEYESTLCLLPILFWLILLIPCVGRFIGFRASPA